MSEEVNLSEVIVKAINALIQFNIELKFAYFMEEPHRAVEASTNIEKSKKILEQALEHLTPRND